MGRVPIPIARRTGEAKSKFISAQRMCNAWLEQDPESGEFAVYSAPGLSLLCDTGVTFPVRGLHPFGSVMLAVIGPYLFTVSSMGVATNQGGIDGTDPVIMSDNGSQAVITVPGLDTYVWDGSTLTPISDPDFQVASSVDFLDQYLVFTKSNSGAFFLSALADATDYDALDIASAESRPDNLVRVLVQNREALLFGTDTLEGWSDVGDADFPFVRDQTYAEVGLLGVYAAALIDNSVAWLANDKTVRIMRAGSPQIISDPLIAAEIESWADASLTMMHTFTLRGHQILVLRNPDGCLLWDASLPAALAWSSRKSYGSNTWRGWVSCTMTVWGGTIVVGDAETGKIYTLDSNTHDEDGDPLVWELTSRTMGPGGMPFTVDAIEVEIEPGVSLVSGQGSAAKVWLELSRDSGFTYGARLERTLGAIGVRNRRIVWRDLGQFPPHGGVFRLSGSDPVATALSKGWADIQADAV